MEKKKPRQKIEIFNRVHNILKRDFQSVNTEISSVIKPSFLVTCFDGFRCVGKNNIKMYSYFIIQSGA